MPEGIIRYVFIMGLLYCVAMIAAGMALALGTATGAQAHEWYDPHCCHERDCAEVTSSQSLPNGAQRLCTKFGCAIFPKNFKKRYISKDGRDHACIRNDNPFARRNGTPVCRYDGLMG
jgi:hypothetical protein